MGAEQEHGADAKSARHMLAVIFLRGIYMDGNAFTKLIKEESRDFAIDWAEGNDIGVSSAAQKWVLALSKKERIFLREIITESVDISLFKLFEIMDGVHSKNSDPIEANSGSDKISGSDCSQLHDLYANKI